MLARWRTRPPSTPNSQIPIPKQAFWESGVGDWEFLLSRIAEDLHPVRPAIRSVRDGRADLSQSRIEDVAPDDPMIPSRSSWRTRGFPVRTPRSPRTPASDSRRRRVDPVARDSAHPAASEPSVPSTPSGPHGVERRASAIGSPRVPAGRPAGVPRWSATPAQMRHSSSLESRLRRSRVRRATNSPPGEQPDEKKSGTPVGHQSRGCKAEAAGRACSSR